MEKFGEWRDSFTGAYPFVPTTARRGSRLALAALPLLVAARVAVALLGCALLLLRAVALPLCCDARPLRVLLDRAAAALWLRAVLGWQPRTAAPLHRVAAASASSLAAAANSARTGLVVAASLTHPADVLVAAAAVAPRWYLLPNSEGSYERFGMLGALRAVAAHAALVPPRERLTSLTSVTHGKGGRTPRDAVVLFAEGVRSYGRGVLPFVDGANDAARDAQRPLSNYLAVHSATGLAHVLALRHDAPDAVHTGLAAFVLRALVAPRLARPVDVSLARALAPSAAPAAAAPTSASIAVAQAAVAASPETPEVGAVRRQIARLLGAEVLFVSPFSKAAFMRAFATGGRR